MVQEASPSPQRPPCARRAARTEVGEDELERGARTQERPRRHRRSPGAAVPGPSALWRLQASVLLPAWCPPSLVGVHGAGAGVPLGARLDQLR